MPYTIEIKGVDKTSLVKAQSLRITKGADNRSDCSLSLITTASAIGTTDGMIIGQDLKVKDGSTVIFGGIIKTIRVVKLAPGTGNTKEIQLDITSDGYNDIPSRRTTTEYYTNKYAGDIVWEVMNILNTTGASEGLSEGTIDDGAFLSVYSAICKSAKEIFDELAEASGYKWYIDDLKFLHFVQDDTVAAAAHDLIETAPTFTDFDVIDVDISLENYRNKQFVRGTKEENGAIIYIGVDDTIEITARQTAEDAAYSSGVYGDVIDSTNIWSVDDATITANNALKRYGAIPYTITFTSMTNDWVAGTKLKVNLPSYGIGSDTYFLIESVNIVDVGGVFMSEVTATRRKESDFSTQRTENYKDYFAKLIKAAKEGYSGNDGSSGQIHYSVETSNEAAVSVTSAAEVVATTIDVDFQTYSKAIIQFSCEIEIATGACDLTAKTYVDGVALTYQPTCYLDSANKFTFTYTDYCHDIEAGTKTVEIKLQTSADTGAISIGHAVMVVTVFGELEYAPASGPTIGYIIGGEDSSWSKISDTDEYTPDTWVSKTNMPLPARDRFPSSAVGAYCYTYGGYGTSGMISDTDEYTPDTWVSKTNMPLPLRFYSASSTIGSSGYVYCGTKGTTKYQDTDEYTPDTWVSKTDAPSPAREMLSASTVNGCGYIFGGANSGSYQDTDEYTPDTWVSKTDMPLPARARHANSAIELHAYIYGGVVVSTLISDTDEYTPDTWVSKTNMPLPKRDGLSGSGINSSCYAFCGAGAYPTILSDTDEYTPDTWVSKTDAPSPARSTQASSSI